MFALECFGTEIAQRGVTAFAIVPDFDPGEDRAPRLFSCLEASAVDHLFLQTGKEALGRSVVPAVASAAHAAYDPDFLKPLLVIVAGVLAPPVAVAEQIGSWLPAEEGHVQSRENQGAIDGLIHRPSDDPTREQIEDHRQIQPSLPGPQVRYVRCPAGIGRLDFEGAVEQVFCNGHLVVAVGGDDKALGTQSADLRKTHQAGDPLWAARDARFLEISADARTAVGFLALLINGLDLLGQRFVLDLALTLWAFSPSVEAASTDLHGPAERREGEELLLLFDELVSHWGRAVKIPTAFFRISFSSLRRLSSR